MRIRKYRQSDCEGVLAIWLEASRVGHPCFDELELQRQREMVQTYYLRVAETWVAEDETGLLGFVSMMDGDMVGGLFVAPERHRQGIGRALLEFVSGRIGKLRVEVFVSNLAARRFYERCGFVFQNNDWNEDVFPPQEIMVLEQR